MGFLLVLQMFTTRHRLLDAVVDEERVYLAGDRDGDCGYVHQQDIIVVLELLPVITLKVQGVNVYSVRGNHVLLLLQYQLRDRSYFCHLVIHLRCADA